MRLQGGIPLGPAGGFAPPYFDVGLTATEKWPLSL